jgi:hypothetical protein
MCREAEAAEARAQEEADRRLQQTDPKASIAWKKGGEHRVSRHLQDSMLKHRKTRQRWGSAAVEVQQSSSSAETH